MTNYALITPAAILLVAACGRPAVPVASTPAAKIQSPVTESSLTTVTLTPEAEKRLGIETVTVERRTVSRTRTSAGELMAPPGTQSVVTAPFAGKLEAIAPLPAAGTTVNGGLPLFRLVPVASAERDAAVDAARAVGEATARRDAADNRLRRALQLAADGAGSRRAAEDAQESFAIAVADLKAAQDRLASAASGGATAAGLLIETPHSGNIRIVHATSGQTVGAGTLLFEIVRLDQLWVRVPLFAGEVGDIDPNASARVLILGAPPEDDGVTARPVAAPPSADPNTAAIDLYFTLANPGQRLRPGQRVSVKLAERGMADQLVVPHATILHDAYGGTWLYEARPERTYVRRRVAIADMVDAYAVLNMGPEPGTRVVTDGAAELFGTEFGAGK